MNYTFELTELYPEKSCFYVLEVILFNTILTKYFCAIGDFEQALLCIDTIEEIDNNFPNLENLETLVVCSIIAENIPQERLEKITSRQSKS